MRSSVAARRTALAQERQHAVADQLDARSPESAPAASRARRGRRPQPRARRTRAATSSGVPAMQKRSSGGASPARSSSVGSRSRDDVQVRLDRRPRALARPVAVLVHDA